MRSRTTVYHVRARAKAARVKALATPTPLMAGRLLVEHACLDHLLIHIEFVFGSSQYLLFHTVDRAQAKNTHLILLSNAMGSILCLQGTRRAVRTDYAGSFMMRGNGSASLRMETGATT